MAAARRITLVAAFPMRTQSFHWMDRPRVAATVHSMLDEDGACLHVHATTYLASSWHAR
jgi:hypothetical protein